MESCDLMSHRQVDEDDRRHYSQPDTSTVDRRPGRPVVLRGPVSLGGLHPQPALLSPRSAAHGRGRRPVAGDQGRLVGRWATGSGVQRRPVRRTLAWTCNRSGFSKVEHNREPVTGSSTAHELKRTDLQQVDPVTRRVHWSRDST